jgi:tRNA(Ile)-lysidine synthase
VIATAIREIEATVGALAADSVEPLVLAVSGGLDSMVLLDAAARVAPARVAVVATFDHASGSHATRAASFVCRQAAARGMPVVAGRAARRADTEAEWREARLEFLRGVAARVGGVVVTAHTEDDQVETVVMRAMRGAGARGLAALYADAPGVRRPFLRVRRSSLESYAAARDVRSVTDPTNESARFFRNRVRHDLLPALVRARPALEGELLEISRRAATWRSEVDGLAATMATDAVAGSIGVAAEAVEGYDAESLAVLWPAIAARVGLALDWRGTRRLAEFTSSRGRVGACTQLAGGWEVVRERGLLTLRRKREPAPPAADLPSVGSVRWGRWSFVRRGRGSAESAWRAALPADRPLVVREWRPGDRMVGPRGTPRRVKRFFGDAGIVGPDRAGWPVVLAGEEIVWIPGVGRAAAVAGASRTPGLIYTCELNDR